MAAPANDNFADSIAVVIPPGGGTWVSDAVLNTEATRQAGEPAPTTYDHWDIRTVWWHYTPAVSGIATIDTRLTYGSSADTEIAIYTGSSVSTLTKRASDRDSGGMNEAGTQNWTSKITNFAVTAGTTYHIQVACYPSRSMNYVLRVAGPQSIDQPDAVSSVFSGTAPAVTGSLAASAAAAPVTGSLAGVAPKVTASIMGGDPNAVVGALTGQAPAVFGDFAAFTSSDVQVEARVDSFNRANGRTRTGLAEAWVEYDLDNSLDREPIRVMAQQMPTPELVNGRPT